MLMHFVKKKDETQTGFVYSIFFCFDSCSIHGKTHTDTDPFLSYTITGQSNVLSLNLVKL